jgi:N-6 DNA Methylase
LDRAYPAVKIQLACLVLGAPHVLHHRAAESGPSKIRQWLLESDLLEVIVALPTNMFFNTGSATYIWILDNTKREPRPVAARCVAL